MDRIPQERYDHPDSTGLIPSERAVTPVMAIILVVAITVILGSIIGAFALHLGDTVQDYAPSTTFSLDYEDGDQTGITCGLSDDDAADEGELTIIHESGDEIDEARLTLTDKEGNTATWNECATTNVSEITSGNKATPEIDSDDTIRLLWVSENDNDDTAVIAKYEGPEA